MSLNAGWLNRRVTFLQRSASQDAAGQPVETWTTYATRWADVRSPSGSAAAEQLAADRETSTVAYSVRLRYCTDITNAMRAQIDGITMDIAQVIPDRAGREHTDVVCVAGAV